MTDYNTIRQQIRIIKNATEEGQNTAYRVGVAMEETLKYSKDEINEATTTLADNITAEATSRQKAISAVISRMQGRGTEHDNTFDPFHFKQFGGGNQAYIDLSNWLDSLHSIDGSVVPLGLLRIYVNGSWMYVLSNILYYGNDNYSQTILNGRVGNIDGSRAVVTGKGMYYRESQLNNGTLEWSEWQRIDAPQERIEDIINSIVNSQTYVPVSGGKIPASYLPAYVDEVLEYSTITQFPAQGAGAKIYIALDTNKQYRWSGSQYIEISASLTLGETAQTAFAGSRGKALEAAQSSLSGKVSTAENNITTLQGALNGKASQSGLTDVTNRVTTVEGDIRDLQSDIADAVIKDNNNTLTGNNTFTGTNTFNNSTTMEDVTADNIDVIDGRISVHDEDYNLSTVITSNSVSSHVFKKYIGNHIDGYVPHDLATIDEVNDAVAGKASTSALQAEVLRAQTAEDNIIATLASKADVVDIYSYLYTDAVLPNADVYIYGGQPISHLRTYQSGQNSWSIVICAEHIDGYEFYHRYFHFDGNANDGYTYMDSYDESEGDIAPEWVKKLFGENTATSTLDGKMSATDKQHVDTLWSERGSGDGGGTDTFATLFAALTDAGGAIRFGNNYMKFDPYYSGSSASVMWGILKSLLLNTHTEGQSADIIDFNHYINVDMNYISNEVYSTDENFLIDEVTIGQDEYAFSCSGSNVIITSGHELYAVALRIRYLGGAVATVNLTVADEDNTQSTMVTLSDTTTFVDCVLDYGSTPLANSKKIIITDASGADINIMLQPTLKFIGG